ncbi:Rid family hydrolase [Brachybacterium sp. GCM10030267]|uniref:Rid family hydrolase n=1 Tax=Brachybacterium sp. GCM10030267 TaxID=3273381 RepID=UPI0036208908
MSHAVTLNSSAILTDTVQYSYSATVEPPARLVVLAGACPLDKAGDVVAPGDHAAQAAKCVENMIVALAEAGASLENVVSTRVLVASSEQADLVSAWDVVRDAFREHPAPSTLMGVTVLGYPAQLVEIEASAAVRD